MSCAAKKTDVFELVADMEDPLMTIKDLLTGIALIAQRMNDDTGGAVGRIAMLGIVECDKAEETRGELFHLTHPRRDTLIREGVR
jgi:hypothetical protein